MSVPIYVVRVEARSDEGDYVEIKLEGLTEPLKDADLETVKQKASDLFEWSFEELPYEILVHDSLKHRAEREVHADDGDRFGVEDSDGRQFIVDTETEKRVFEIVNIRPGDTATAAVVAFRLNAGRDHAMPDNVKEITA